MGQILSNLLGHAVTHGAENGPIRATARDTDGLLQLRVTHHGPPIPEDNQASVFRPVARGGASTAHPDGLGLGLHIAAEIARAVEGSIDLTSKSVATTFTLTMPAVHE